MFPKVFERKNFLENNILKKFSSPMQICSKVKKGSSDKYLRKKKTADAASLKCKET
jgi:hypothetical protein